MNELEKLWKNKRKIGGATFAGLSKLTKFKDGRQLTNSARVTFQNCRKKYEFSYVYGLAPRKPSVPFLVGGLFHNELDIMYTNKKFSEVSARKRIAEACEKASGTEGLTPEDSDNIWIQQAITVGMVKGYAEQYLDKDLKQWEIIEPESAFRVAVDSGKNPWEYRGKIDMVIKIRKTKAIAIVEHKTAGRLDANYVAKLPLDSQILGYCSGKRKEGVNVSEVIYNVTKKPQIRQRQNESLNQFYKRVEDEYISNPGIYFYREQLAFNPADLDRFDKELERFVGEIDRCADAQYFYQNTSHCTSMGVCPFMKLCLDGVNKETLMFYRIKERAHEELPDDD